MIGCDFTRLVPRRYESEHDAKPVTCSWGEIMRRTGSTTLAIGRTRKQVTFPVEISLSEMLIDQQLFYVAMVRDVTERKRFEQQIAAEKESLAVTLRAIGDGVITCDVDGKVIMMNSEAEKLTGWTLQEANRSTSQVCLRRDCRSCHAGESTKERLSQRGAVDFGHVCPKRSR